MPIIKPEVQKVLIAAGLSKEPTLTPSEAESLGQGSLEAKFLEVGLSNETLADQLYGLAINSSNEALRLRAIETILKVKGSMREKNIESIPQFTIIIQNSAPPLRSSHNGINPIIYPRQSLNSVLNCVVDIESAESGENAESEIN